MYSKSDYRKQLITVTVSTLSIYKNNNFFQEEDNEMSADSIVVDVESPPMRKREQHETNIKPVSWTP
jgi:hypothetical protein